jgi:hypothetical protein
MSFVLREFIGGVKNKKFGSFNNMAVSPPLPPHNQMILIPLISGMSSSFFKMSLSI